MMPPPLAEVVVQPEPAASSGRPAPTRLTAQASLTAQTFHGLTWSYASTVINAALQIVFIAIMARLLTPADFGLMAMAGVAIRFGNYFARMGVGSAIVQKPTLSQEEIHAAFLLSVSLGLVAGLLTWIAAPAAALIFEQPKVVPLVRVMGLSFVLTGFSISAYNLLRRNLNFRAVCIVDVVSYVLGYGVVGIGMALYGFGVWSLVGASLGITLVGTMLAHLLTRHGLSLVRRWACYRPLLAFGSRVSLVSFFEFVGMSLDTVVIGRWMGAGALGLYTRGQELVRLPMYQLSTSCSRVLLPSFSRVQDDTRRLRGAFLTAVTLTGAVLVPACVGLAVAAPEAVLLLLGPQWTGAIPVLQILAFAAALDVLAHFSGITCEATATLNVKIAIQLLFIALLGGGFALLRGYGLTGFAVAVLGAQVVRYGVYAAVMQRLLVIRPAELARAHLAALVNTLVIGAALYVAALALRGARVPVAAAFGLEVALGAVLLGGLLLFSPVGGVRREISTVLYRLGTPLSLRLARQLRRLA